MDTSDVVTQGNIFNICCISRENCELKNIIQQQSNEIGKILQEKREIQEQYNMLLQSIEAHSIVVSPLDEQSSNTSNIVDNTSNIVDNTSNMNSSNLDNTSNIV